MLTNEIINQNEILQTLTDEQKNVIVELSQNDENATIGAKLSEIYKKLDSTIETATGIKRDGDEKTYKYLERAAKLITAEKQELTKKIENAQTNNNNEEQAKKDFEELSKKYLQLQKDFDKANKQHSEELKNIAVDSVLTSSLSKINFNSSIPQNVLNLCRQQVIAKLKQIPSEFVTTEQGDKVLIFKNQDGAILRNENNALRPFTADEIMQKEFAELGIVAQNNNGGLGTDKPKTIFQSGLQAKTRVQAYDEINGILISQGLQPGTDSYKAKFAEYWKTNNVAKLPER